MKVTRRTFLRTTGAIVGGLATGSVFRTAGFAQQRRPRQLVVASGGGALTEAQREAYYKPFQEATGIEIIEDAYESAKLRAMVESGNVQWDVVSTDPVWALGTLVPNNLVEPLDFDIIDRSQIYDWALHDRFIVSDVAAFVLAYNANDYADDPPQSWDAMWDVERYRGRRGWYARSNGPIEAALLADGVPPEQLYPMDIDRAFRSLDRLKPHITAWWRTGAQSAQLLSDRAVDITATFNGRVQPLIDAGHPLAFTFNEAILVHDAWAVPRGVRNREWAMEFINFALHAERQAVFSRNIPYGPTNPKAFDYLDDAAAAKLPNHPANTRLIRQDWASWANLFDAIQERYEYWMVS